MEASTALENNAMLSYKGYGSQVGGMHIVNPRFLNAHATAFQEGVMAAYMPGMGGSPLFVHFLRGIDVQASERRACILNSACSRRANLKSLPWYAMVWRS